MSLLSKERVAVALFFIVCEIALFIIVVFVLLFDEYVKPE